MKISFRLILVSGFSLLFLCAWVIPVILIRNGATISINNAIGTLVDQTTMSMTGNMQRQFNFAANIGLAARNWSINWGNPFDSPVNHRVFNRVATGLFLSNLGYAFVGWQYRYSKQVSNVYVDPFSDTGSRYELCRIDHDYNFSYATPQENPVATPSECSLMILNRSSGETSTDTNFTLPVLQRSYYNSTLDQLIVAQTAFPTSQHYQDYFNLGIFYTPQWGDRQKFQLAMTTGANYKNSGVPLVAMLVPVSTDFIQVALKTLLPRDSGDSRSYLLDLLNRVLVASNGNYVQDFVNVSALDFATKFNPVLCGYEGVSMKVGCVYNISSHEDYFLLRDVNAAAKSEGEYLQGNEFTASRNGEVYLWEYSPVRFSRTNVYKLFVFIPRHFYMKDIEAATTQIIAVVVVLIVFGAVSVFLLLRPIVNIIDSLTERLAKDPFDPDLVHEFASSESSSSSSVPESPKSTGSTNAKSSQENSKNNSHRIAEESSASDSFHSGKWSNNNDDNNDNNNIINKSHRSNRVGTVSSPAPLNRNNFTDRTSSSKSSSTLSGLGSWVRSHLDLRCVKIQFMEIAYIESCYLEFRRAIENLRSFMPDQAADLMKSRTATQTGESRMSRSDHRLSEFGDPRIENNEGSTGVEDVGENNAVNEQNGRNYLSNDSSASAKEPSAAFLLVARGTSKKSVKFKFSADAVAVVQPAKDDDEDDDVADEEKQANGCTNKNNNNKNSSGNRKMKTHVVSDVMEDSDEPSLGPFNNSPAVGVDGAAATSSDDDCSSNNSSISDADVPAALIRSSPSTSASLLARGSLENSKRNKSPASGNTNSNNKKNSSASKTSGTRGRFLVAAIEVKVSELDRIVFGKNTIDPSEKDQVDKFASQNPADQDISEPANTRLQLLIDEIQFAVQVINDKVLLPTGATLIEYRNNSFLVALRLAKKSVRSKLATRFCECLMDASETLAEKHASHLSKQMANENKRRRFLANPGGNLPDDKAETAENGDAEYSHVLSGIMLTAGIATGYATVLKLNNDSNEAENENDNAKNNNKKSKKNVPAALDDQKLTAAISLRPFSIVGEVVSAAFDCCRFMRKHLDRFQDPAGTIDDGASAPVATAAANLSAPNQQKQQQLASLYCTVNGDKSSTSVANISSNYFSEKIEAVDENKSNRNDDDDDHDKKEGKRNDNAEENAKGEAQLIRNPATMNKEIVCTATKTNNNNSEGEESAQLVIPSELSAGEIKVKSLIFCSAVAKKEIAPSLPQAPENNYNDNNNNNNSASIKAPSSAKQLNPLFFLPHGICFHHESSNQTLNVCGCYLQQPSRDVSNAVSQRRGYKKRTDDNKHSRESGFLKNKSNNNSKQYLHESYARIYSSPAYEKRRKDNSELHREDDNLLRGRKRSHKHGKSANEEFIHRMNELLFGQSMLHNEEAVASRLRGDSVSC